MPTRKNRFLLLYGSQTGQAEAITEEIAEAAESHGFVCERHSLAHTEKKFVLENESCVVIVTSTTGDGEPPDSALKFVRRLKKKSLPDTHLQNVNFALLGLGDSNYTNFCNCGKTLDRRMEELGAKRFYSSGWGDDAVGLEVAVEPWIEGLWPALHEFLSIKCSRTDNPCQTSISTSNCGNDHDQTTSTKQLSDNCTKESDPMTTSNGTSNCTENGRCDLNVNAADHSVVVSVNGNTCTNTNAIQDANCDILSNEQQNSTLNLNGVSGTSIANTSADKKQNGNAANDKVKSSDSIQANSTLADSSNRSDSGAIVSDLRSSLPPLCDAALSVPVLPQPFLKLSFHLEDSVDLQSLPYQNGANLPSAATPITMVTVESAQVMTSSDSVKKTLCLRLKMENEGTIKYEPGDSISICCQNGEKEVERLLDRLGHSQQADIPCELSLISDTKKKNAALPPHLPPRATLRHMFTHCVDIREPPKKAFLRALVDCTSDPLESRRLQELCSKQGATDYTKHIREAGISILDLLNTFPSCCPSVDRILEFLPRLQPRPYSVCSSPLIEPNILEIVFNIVEISKESGRSFHRQGVCTGMIDRLTRGNQTEYKSTLDHMERLKLDDVPRVELSVFGRTHQNFHPPDDLSVPIIMIGPGTGVAPFIGFCRHREALRSKMADTSRYGTTWLFFGCRHQKKDFLYRNEMEYFLKTGVITELRLSFSRDEQPSDSPRYVQDSPRYVQDSPRYVQDSPRYVQDHILRSGNDLVDLLDNQGARVFVCGDAKNMAKDVNQAFIKILQDHKGIGEDEARSYLMQLRLKRRYLEDVWT